MGTAAHNAIGETIDTTDAFQRKGWQNWYIPTFLGALIAMVSVIAYLVHRQTLERAAKQSDGSNMVVQTSLQKAKDEKSTLVPTNIVTVPEPSKEWGAKVRVVSDDFLRATTAAELLTLIRNPKEYTAKIESYAAVEGHLPIGKKGVLDIIYAPEEDGQRGTLAMLFFENNEQHVQGLVLADTPEGLLVDWPSFSGEGDMSIKDFLAQKPEEPTLLRVAARLDDYYNFEFQDREQVTCLRLTDFPETCYFYGYVITTSPLIKKTTHLPTQDHNAAEDMQTKPQPLTIRARFHAGTQSPNQVEILDIVGDGWFVR
jgi:hypothetical protein